MAAATPQVPRPRIQGLSDLIFGLALSIGAIQFIGNVPADPIDLEVDILTFGFSFLILIRVWNQYTTTTSVMPVETPGMIRLNMLLLFLVAIEPFLFAVLVIRGFSQPVGAEASLCYGLDIGAMNLILAYFSHLLSQEERNLVPAELIGRFRIGRNAQLLGSAIFIASDLPFFGGDLALGLPARVFLWILTLPILWSSRTVESRISRSSQARVTRIR